MATNQIKLVINATDNSSTALKSLANNINNIKKGVVSLSSDTTNATSRVGGMNATLTKTPGLFSKIGQGAKRALTIFGGYKILSGVFNSIAGSMDGAINRIDTMDLFERKMKILTGDASKASYALNEMKTATKGTAYGLDTAAKAVQNFVTRGMSTEDATASVRTWMDAVAVYGNGTNEALTSVVNALGKMRSKGTVEMRHINSMINAGINPVQLYANATNQSAAEVQTQLSEKTLRTEEFLNVVENALRTGANGVANVTGMAQRMATTWKATFDNMHFALNRGWAEMIDGADSLLQAFDENGLKGVFKGFGVSAENIMTGVGKTLNRTGQTIRDFYGSFIASHKQAQEITNNTAAINLDIGARIKPDTGEKFKNSFLGELGNYAQKIAAGFIVLENTWARFRQALAQGINQIAPQLGVLFGTLFGEGVTNATDLLNVFLNWMTLKLPQFFNWVQEKLTWLIEHKDSVINMAEMVLKAFIGWQALKSVQNIVVGFNEKLKALNTTLGFFTGGKLQLPTLENKGSFFGASDLFKDKVTVDQNGNLLDYQESFYKKSKNKVKDTLSSSKQKMRTGISDIGDRTGLSGLKEKTKSGFGKAKEKIKGGLGAFKNRNKTKKKPETDWGDYEIIDDGLGNTIKNASSSLDGFNQKLLGTTSLVPVNNSLAKGAQNFRIYGSAADVAGDGVDDVSNALALGAQNFRMFGGNVGSVADNLDETTTAIALGAQNFRLYGSAADVAASGTALVTDEAGALVVGAETASSSSGGLLSSIISLGSGFLSMAGMVAVAVAAVGAITMALGALNPGNTVSKGITAFFENFNNLVLSFGDYAVNMIQNFVNGIIANADQLREQGVNLVLSIVTGILTTIPNLLATGIQIVGGLIAGLVQMLPTLVYQGFMAIGQFVAGLISAIPNILQGMGNILMALAQFILTNLPMFIESGIQLIGSIITGIGGMVSQVMGALGDLLTQTWNWIISGDALTMFQDVGSKLVDWMLVGLAKTSWGATVLGWFGQDADAILQKAETDGAQTGENYTQNLQATIDTAPMDITSIWNNANIDQNNATAQEMGLAGGQSFVNAEQAAIDGASVDTDVFADSAEQDIETATTAGDSVGTAFTDSASNALNTGAANIGAAASNVQSQITITFDNEAVRQQATDFLNTIAIVFTEQCPILYQTTGNIGTGAVNELVAHVNAGIPQAMATGVGLTSSLKQGIDIGFDQVRAAISLGVVTLYAMFTGVNETFTIIGSTISTSLATGILTTSPQVIANANTLKATVIECLRGISEGAYSIGRSTMESFHNGILAYQNTVVTDFESLIDTIKVRLETQMKSMSEEFNTIAGSMMDNVYTTLNKRFNDVQQLVGNKRLNIENTFHSIISAFETMGGEMMDGLTKGISDNMQKALDATSDLVSKLKETFEKGLGIHSPSDYTTWVGQMMLAGLEEGMTPSDVASWIVNVINRMQSSFAAGNFNAAETMDFLSQQGALDLIAKVTDMDLSAVENASPAAVPAIIQEAMKYVGYHGSGGLNGSSMFGLHYGNPGAWCVSFVRYCAEQVGVPFPATNYVPDVTAWAQANGRWTMTPQPGYAAIFSNRHIELVAGVNGSTIDYIGGNTGNGEVKHRPRSDATGFVALDGGHATNTLASQLQMAYDMKYNPGALAIGTGSVNWSPDAGVAQWTNIVQQALQMLGQPLSLTNDVLYAIQRESSGNPNDTNNWDSNAAKGINSRGLLQVIPETFANNRNPSLSNNIYDPLANVYAGLNYMIKRYGGISNVVNPRRSSRSGWYGYAVGTRYVPEDMLAMIHKGEAILPAGMNPYSDSGGDYLSELAQSMFLNSGVTAGTENLTTSSTSNNTVITLNSPITVNVDGDTTQEELGQNIGEEIHRALMRAIDIGNAR